jgi:uncharacterized membrane protein YdjX (TVP38/TMEM64 family)
VVNRRIVLLVVFLLVVVAIGLGARHLPSIAWLVDHEQQLRDYVATHPITGWCVGLFVYFGLSMIPGTGGKSVICGWLYGFWGAVLMVDLGLTGAALLSFLLGRFVITGLVGNLPAKWFRRVSRGLGQAEASCLLLLRFAHAPFTLVNYGASIAGVKLTTFWWTTHVGILPGTMVFTYAGTQIPTLHSISEEGLWTLLSPSLLGALVLIAAFPFAVQLALRRFHLRYALNETRLELPSETVADQSPSREPDE